MLSSADLLKRFRVTDGSKFRLDRVDPDDYRRLQTPTRSTRADMLARGLDHLCELQERLYAQDR